MEPVCQTSPPLFKQEKSKPSISSVMAGREQTKIHQESVSGKTQLKQRKWKPSSVEVTKVRHNKSTVYDNPRGKVDGGGGLLKG